MLRRNRRAGLARPSGLPHFELYSRPLMSGFHTDVQQLVSKHVAPRHGFQRIDT